MSRQSEPSLSHLSDFVCQIIGLWGEGEPLDGERIVEIASNLYGYSRGSIIEAIINCLNIGKLKGKYYQTS